ncbi:MAG: S26 family signal peptidase [Ardenticatenaceae bacterium]|nr:S26 family signal peptidase [Ardenticatenaceae bacterium]
MRDFSAATIPLLRQALQNGQSVRLKIISGSMDPLLQIGDTVVVEPVEKEQLSDHIGEIITFVNTETLFTHRLIECDGHTFQAASDRTGTLDPRLPVGAVLGRVIARERREFTMPFTSGQGEKLSSSSYQMGLNLIKVKRRLPHFFFRPVYWSFRIFSRLKAIFY